MSAPAQHLPVPHSCYIAYDVLMDRPGRLSVVMRWSVLPMWTRVVVLGYALGFIVGAVASVFDLITYGTDAYAAAPLPARILFASLVILDPLVAIAALRVRRAAPWLACAVLGMVALGLMWRAHAPNGLTQPPAFIGPAWGLILLELLFGVFVFATAIPVWRKLTTTGTASAS